MSNETEKYKDRHKEWRDISISQLSTANNVLLTLSSGLFALCIDKYNGGEIYFNLCYSFDPPVATYCLSILLLGVSIFYGLGVLFSRLYDFRVSRHIALTRQRLYKEQKKELPYTDFGKFSMADKFHALFFCVFCKLPFINSDDVKRILEDEKLKNDFQNLKRTSDILGQITWKWTKIQIGLFLASGIMYLIHQIVK